MVNSGMVISGSFDSLLVKASFAVNLMAWDASARVVWDDLAMMMWWCMRKDCVTSRMSPRLDTCDRFGVLPLSVCSTFFLRKTSQVKQNKRGGGT